MKLRIKGNTIRIRIQQQELIDLEKQGFLKEELAFGVNPSEKMTYRLDVSKDAKTLTADLSNQCISVLIPKDSVSELIGTDQSVLAGKKHIGEGQSLTILVEKDFKCLTHRAEDIDAFPHPEAITGHTC